LETILLLFLLGCLVGFIGGYAGIGGAPFLVVFLVAALGMSQYAAQGTVLAVMLGPMSLLAVLSLWKQVKPNLMIIAIGVLMYAAMSYCGACAAYMLREDILKMLFAFLLIALGLYNMYRSRTSFSQTQTVQQIGLVQMVLVGGFIGVVGGLFGIGAGVLMVPIFINIFHMDKDEARAISLAILLPPVSIGAVIKYHEMGAIQWEYALAIFTGYFLLNYFGGKKAAGHNLQKFKLYFGIILVLLGLSYVYLN